MVVKVLELKWLGHASWKIKTGGKVIYIDPYEGNYDEKADIILSTHHHDDHCKPEKVRQARGPNTVIVATPECGSKIGAPVVTLKPGEKKSLGDVTVEAVEAYNFKRFRSPGTPFHPRGIGVGFLLRAEGKTIYHVGDSDLIPEMKRIKGIDLLLIPSGGTYTMDNAEAAEATIEINPRKAVPIHRWDTDPKEYKEKVESSCDTEVLLLRPGETITL
jgi:L-ascorbate metabolism protein UlaG (beta-lactamase superfamily)